METAAERPLCGSSCAGSWGQRHSNGVVPSLVILCCSFGLKLLAHSSPHEHLSLCNSASLKLHLRECSQSQWRREELTGLAGTKRKMAGSRKDTECKLVEEPEQRRRKGRRREECRDEAAGREGSRDSVYGWNDMKADTV